MKPIDAVLGLYEHRFQTRNVQIFKRYRETPPVFAHSGEFKQVLSNLILNALDAMPVENPQLVLRVSPAKDWGYSDALGVRISVMDNGAGIPSANLPKIFDPFFTTKRATGTGLGLWLSREIVRKHGDGF